MTYQVLTILDRSKQMKKLTISVKDCQKVLNGQRVYNLNLIEIGKGRVTRIVGKNNDAN